MSLILEHFDALCKLNFKVIPLRKNSKAPIFKNWTKVWNRENIRSSLQKNSSLNIGLLLGEVIDVEGDSEEANEKILEMTKDYPHPMYISSKSIHHLFLSPEPDFRYLSVDKIEFRGFGHQSVLPPSIVDGIEYQWLKSSMFPVPEMPLDLKDYFYRYYCLKYGEQKEKRIKFNHSSCVCKICNREFKMHSKRLGVELKVFKVLNQNWQCKSCRSFDLRSACRVARNNVPDHVILSKLVELNQ